MRLWGEDGAWTVSRYWPGFPLSKCHIQVPSRKTAEGIEQPSQLSAVPLLPQDKAEMPAPLQGIPSAAPYPRARGGFGGWAPAVWAMAGSQDMDPLLQEIHILLMRHWKYNQSFLLKSLGKIFLRGCYSRKAQQQASARQTSAIG